MFGNAVTQYGDVVIWYEPVVYPGVTAKNKFLSSVALALTGPCFLQLAEWSTVKMSLVNMPFSETWIQLLMTGKFKSYCPPSSFKSHYDA